MAESNQIPRDEWVKADPRVLAFFEESFAESPPGLDAFIAGLTDVEKDAMIEALEADELATTGAPEETENRGKRKKRKRYGFFGDVV